MGRKPRAIVGGWGGGDDWREGVVKEEGRQREGSREQEEKKEDPYLLELIDQCVLNRSLPLWLCCFDFLFAVSVPEGNIFVSV